MKYLQLFLLLTFSKLSTGQEIELLGKYSASFLGSETIEFIGKDSFYFSGSYCLTGVRGKGRCEIRNNCIYFYFEKSTSEKDSINWSVITKKNSSSDFLDLEITVADNNEIPIPYATVEIERVSSKKISLTADSSGMASIKISKNSSRIIIKTSSVAIEPGHLELEGGWDYKVKIYHRVNDLVDRTLNKGEVFVYEIDDLTEDLILMRPQKSFAPFRKYKKLW